MHSCNQLLLLLCGFHLAKAFTFSEPSGPLSKNATQTPLSNLTSSSLLRQEVIQCDPPNTGPPLDEDDCFGASVLLPSHSAHARFHRGPGRDYYKLPLSVSQGNCRIRVDLIDHVTEDESSWDDVYVGTFSLLHQCVEMRGGLGGNILVGDSLRIQVVVHYTVDEAAGKSNNSAKLSSRTSTPSSLSASTPHCYPPSTGSAPDPLDCLIVQDWLSHNPSGHIFHRAGANDGYRLPVLDYYQTCGISVALVDDVQAETSSWGLVAAGAVLLIARCVLNGGLGGEIFVGERDRMRVTVEYSHLETSQNKNSAILLGRSPSLTSLNASVPHCYPPGTGEPPTAHDCLVAQNSMPDSSTEGTFHKGGAYDGRRLPVRYNHYTCNILIELVGNVQEEKSTWSTLAWQTWVLMTKCVLDGSHQGGDVLVGERNHIRVTVEYLFREARGNNNSTIPPGLTPSPRLNESVSHCYPPGTGGPPDPNDCVSALDPMPSSTTYGTFHKGGANDGRRLPIKYNYQTCDIFVELEDDVPEDKSSWLRVTMETEELIHTCVIEGVNLGGYILIGEQSHIRVTVKYANEEAEGTITAGDVESA